MPTSRRRRRLDKVYADKAYDHRRCRRYLRRRGIKPGIARRRIESSARLGRHRWTIERTGAWLGGFRRLRIRYERSSERCYALAMLGLYGDLLQRPSAAALVTGKAFHDTQVDDRYRPGVPARVYLLGGSSSVGKTTAATVIAERLGAVHLQLDSIARASTDPRVRRFAGGVDNLWRLPAAHVCDLLIRKGDALAATLHRLVGQCLAGDSVTLVEGEGIHPSLAPHHPGDLVRFGFVLEPEETVLFQTLAGRSPRFRALPQTHQHTVAATNWLYGCWLRQQAEVFGQPWVTSRPWPTLPDRLLQAWERPTPQQHGAPVPT